MTFLTPCSLRDLTIELWARGYRFNCGLVGFCFSDWHYQKTQRSLATEQERVCIARKWNRRGEVLKFILK